MKHIPLAFILMSTCALAQQPNGVINAPIYATGYITQGGGTSVTTAIQPNSNHPTNLNIYTTSAISGTWTIKLPNPAFEGQVLSFMCGSTAAAITVTSSDGSIVDNGIPTSCVAGTNFAIQFDQRNNIWRSLFVNTITATNIPAFTGGDCVSSSGSVVLNCTSLVANLNFATKAQFTVATIPSTVHAISVDQVATGYACPMTYTRGTGSSTGIYGEVLNNGIYWQPRYSLTPINACEFGIDPSAANNTVALQAALNYLQSNGGKLMFPAGNVSYSHASTLIFNASAPRSNWAIEGNGTKLKPTSAVTGSQLAISGAYYPINGIISGLVFDHTNATNLQYGLDLAATGNVTVERNTFILDSASAFKAGYASIYLHSSVPGDPNYNPFWTTIRNNTFRPITGPTSSNAYASILLNGGNNAVNIGPSNMFSSLGQFGIKQTYDTGVTSNGINIFENWFEGVTTGISVDGTPSYYWPEGWIIRGNRVEAVATFIEMNQTSAGTVGQPGHPLHAYSNDTLAGLYTNYIVNINNAPVSINEPGAFASPNSSVILPGDETRVYQSGGLNLQNPNGASSYNTGYIRMAPYYIWQSNDLRLFMKDSKPTTATDGWMIARFQSGPRVITASTDTLTLYDTALIFNSAGTITETLGTGQPGQVLRIKSIGAGSVVSASSNVVPLNSSTPGTAMLSGAGKWAELSWDGIYWQTMAAN